MKHTSIINYKESINNPEGLFKTLRGVVPKRNAYGEVVFLAGNNSVTFRVSIDEKWYGIKCYIKRKDNLERIYDLLGKLPKDSKLVAAKLLEDELYVFDIFDKGAFYDIVQTDWIEGQTLELEIRRGIKEYGKEYIRNLSEKFDSLAIHILQQRWAHGDLKPENIIVCPDGEMKLIDYDAFFFPELSADHATEIGTPTYQHPKRDENFYDKHIDDYSIALISVSLRALAHRPSLYEKYNRSDNIILTPSKILNNSSEAYREIMALFAEVGDHDSYRLATLLRSNSPIISDLQQFISGSDADAGDLTLSEKGGKWGYVDNNGAWALMPIYDFATDFHEDVAIVTLLRVESAIDRSGNTFLTLKYDSIKPFSEGLAAVMIDGKWGYVNKSSELVIKPQFDQARLMKGGFAAVKLGDGWGYIDYFGELVVEPKYSRAMGIREGYGVVYLGEEMAKIDLRAYVKQRIE